MSHKNFISIKNQTGTSSAEIEIFGYIGERWWEDADKQNTFTNIANKIKQIKADNITVKINSLGGDVVNGLSIYDILKDHSAKITVQINGFCASIATIIAMAGDTVKMSNNALFLIHQCHSSFYDMNAKRIEEAKETLQTIDARLLSIYKERTGKTEDEITTLLEANNGDGKWITAADAKEFGFVDEIYNETKIAACITSEMFKNTNLPTLPSGYEALVANSEKETSAFDDLKNFITNLFNKSQKADMKTSFPTICVLLALASDVKADSEFAISNEQLTLIENKLKELEVVTAERDKLKAESETATATIQDMNKEVEALKEQIKKTPATTTQLNGSDSKEKSSFEDYIENDPMYKEFEKLR